jgi:hypothetical protein
MEKKNHRLEVFLMLNPNIKEEKSATWTFEYSQWIKQQIREASADKHDSIYYSTWYDDRILDQDKFNGYLFEKFNYKGHEDGA